MDKKNFYVTSPIYYVNDIPHIGHAYTSIACDVIARFKRLNDYSAFFLTGTDEHGQKVEKSAKKKGKEPQEFCNEVAQHFTDLTKKINLSNDDFIRTSQDRHKKCAQKFWQILEENGYIYKGEYEGWYSIRDEAFYSKDEVIDGKAPTGAEVEWHKEESYFFKLSAFEDQLLKFYQENPDFIRPKTRYNEVVSFVKGGLKDLSISRNSFSWGVHVPGDESHVIYVWLDALTNYLSALDFCDENSEQYQDFWINGSPLHIVGKDIIRFHAVYWPAFLMAAKVELPKRIFAHGWWTNEGEKISKSLGNVINPDDETSWLTDITGKSDLAVDYFRFFLLREVPFGNDGDYGREQLSNRINAELANNIGNLTQRTLAMINKNCEGKVIFGSESIIDEQINHKSIFQSYSGNMEKLAFDKALVDIIELANLANKSLNDKEPWNLRKAGKIDEMNLILARSANLIRIIALMLIPFTPSSAQKMLDFLNIDQDQRNFASLENHLENNHLTQKPEAIFLRIEDRDGS